MLDWLRVRPFVVAYRATVRDNHPNGLCAVQRAPTAQPNEAVALFFFVNPCPSVHHRNRRVADDLAPDDIILAGGTERLGDALKQTGTRHTPIPNDHVATQAQLLDDLQQRGNGARGMMHYCRYDKAAHIAAAQALYRICKIAHGIAPSAFMSSRGRSRPPTPKEKSTGISVAIPPPPGMSPG